MLRSSARPLLLAALVIGCISGSRTRPMRLSNVIASSEMPVSINAFIRVLPDGQVLVTDNYGTKLWLLDANLSNARLIGDTTNRFMPMGTYVHPYLGDSSFLVRSGISDGFIIDGQGRKVREVKLRGPYWGTGPITTDMLRAPFTSSGVVMALSEKPRLATATIESLYVVRTSFTSPTRRDTLDLITREAIRPNHTFIPKGDGAGMFSDGAIAIVRASDYSLHVIEPDGRRWAKALPHMWTVLGPKDKQQIIDSTRAASPSRPVTLTVADIPDTVPSISWVGKVVVDADDYLWIEQIIVQTNPYRPAKTGTFDIVDRQGNVVRRVTLPQFGNIKAFAPGRVYYSVRENGVDHLVVASTSLPRKTH